MEVAGCGSIVCSTGTDEKRFLGKMKHKRHRPHRHVYSAVLRSHKSGQSVNANSCHAQMWSSLISVGVRLSCVGQSDLSKAVLADQIDKGKLVKCVWMHAPQFWCHLVCAWVRMCMYVLRLQVLRYVRMLCSQWRHCCAVELMHALPTAREGHPFTLQWPPATVLLVRCTLCG